MTRPVPPVLSDPAATEAVAAALDDLVEEWCAVPAGLRLADQVALWAGVADLGRWLAREADLRHVALRNALEIGER